MALALHWLLRCGGKSPLGNRALPAPLLSTTFPCELSFSWRKSVQCGLVSWTLPTEGSLIFPMSRSPASSLQLETMLIGCLTSGALPRAHTGCHTHTSSFTLSPNHTPVFCFLVSFLFAFTSKPSDLKHHAQQRSCLINSIAVFALWQIHPWQEKKLDFYVHKR